MRLLLINYEYPPVGGGAATATEALGREFVRLGHSVVVLTGSYKDLPASCEADGIIVRRIPALRRRLEKSGIVEMTSFLVAGQLVAPSLIRRHRIEGTIAFFSFPSGPVALAGWAQCGVPYVVALRGGDVPGTEPSLRFMHQFLQPLRRAILRRALAVVANSEGLKKMAESSDAVSVRVIPNGVDTSLFRPGPGRTVGSHPLRVIFVGRLRSQKNVPVLFQQLARLPAGTWKLDLVGDGPLRKELFSLADRLGLTNSITWHGWIPRLQLRDLYQDCDCLVNPSLYEGMANAVLEAMASELAVLASKVPGNSDLVLHGETGYLFDLLHPDELGDGLLALTRESQQCRRFGAAGRARVARLFSWAAAAASYVSLFEPVGVTSLTNSESGSSPSL